MTLNSSAFAADFLTLYAKPTPDVDGDADADDEAIAVIVLRRDLTKLSED